MKLRLCVGLLSAACVILLPQSANAHVSDRRLNAITSQAALALHSDRADVHVKLVASALPVRSISCEALPTDVAGRLPAGVCATSKDAGNLRKAGCTGSVYVASINQGFGIHTATVVILISCSNIEYAVAFCGTYGLASVGFPPFYEGFQVGLGPFCGAASTPFGFVNAVNVDGTGLAVIGGQLVTFDYSGRADP